MAFAPSAQKEPNMKEQDRKPQRITHLAWSELRQVQGGSGSNTVFVRRNGETGILVEGGMSGGTGVGG